MRIESSVFVRKQRRQKESALSREALSEILAAKARDWPEVKEFRRRVLGGRLLKAEKVAPWITNLREREPGSFVPVIVKVPRKANLGRRELRWILDSPVVVRADDIVGVPPAEIIAYETPGSSWVQKQPIAGEGTLKQLHNLCQNLTNSYKWEPYQATMFVLTDLIPLVSRLRYEVQPTMPISALSRVRLTIDPAMSPHELAQEYGKIRNKILSPKKPEGSTRKPRALTEKHARLAAFAAKIPKAELDEEDMKTWNRKHPRWKYPLLKNFTRDWKKAQQRLAKGPASAFDYFKAYD